MNIQDKIENWSMQLEQAQQYGLFFDWQTVKEMIETIEELNEKTKRHEQAFIDIMLIHNYNGFKAKGIAEKALKS
jgi:hypothetical protein